MPDGRADHLDRLDTIAVGVEQEPAVVRRAGTAIGAFAGSGSVLFADAATAMFPVLFVGLAAISIEDRAGLVRTVAAGLGTLALVYAFPAERDFVPVAAALAVVLVGGRR